MLEQTLKLANVPGLWLCALVTVALVFVQAGLFVRLAKKEAKRIDFGDEKLKTCFKIGLTSSVGPAVSSLVVLVGMVAAVGAPITWMRLSIIGAAPTELMSASIAADTLGLSMGDPNYGPEALSLAFFAMAITVTGWLLLCALFTDKVDGFLAKAGGGDKKWTGLIAAGAGIAAFAYMTSTHCVKGGSSLCAALSGIISMMLLNQFVVPKCRKIGEWSLAICMIVAMIVGGVSKSIIGY